MIKHNLTTSLSPSEVQALYRKLTKGSSIRVIDYEQIINCPDIHAFFTRNPSIIIFYPSAKAGSTIHGHYCCLSRNPKRRTFFFYDPLAYNIDEYKKFALHRTELYKEKQNSLVKGLLASGWACDYNTHQHQSRKSEIATCGRHSAVRASFPELTNDQYNRLLYIFENKRGLKDRLIVKVTE